MHQELWKVGMKEVINTAEEQENKMLCTTCGAHAQQEQGKVGMKKGIKIVKERQGTPVRMTWRR
eukprot:scaffold207905_cov17-Tisochrysis_lutea.AAC.1